MFVKLSRALLVSAAIAGTSIVALPVETAQAQGVEVSIGTFYDGLAPHGRWVYHPRWGWVWFPMAVGPGWRPYSQGRWVWTEEYGWYWVSDEPWGWATYHYGRWGYDPAYGWIWVPGTVWAPAWVSMRHGAGHVGWVPLPPETLHATSPVFAESYSEPYYQPRWIFVPERYFIAPRIGFYIVRPVHNHIYFSRTTIVTNYITVNNVIVNRSIAPNRIQMATGRPVVPFRVTNVNVHHNATINRGNATTINVYRPTIRTAPDAAPPPAARARPGDRPRINVQNNFVAPSDRRTAPITTTPPTGGTPPGATGPGTPPSTRTGPPPGGTPPGATGPGTPPSTRTGPPTGGPPTGGTPPGATGPGTPPSTRTGPPPGGPPTGGTPPGATGPGTPPSTRTGPPPGGPPTGGTPPGATGPGTPPSTRTGPPPGGPPTGGTPPGATGPGTPPSARTGPPPGSTGPGTPPVMRGVPPAPATPSAPPPSTRAAPPPGGTPPATGTPPAARGTPTGRPGQPACGQPGQPACPPAR